jgi:hypothetical protein
MRSRRSFVAAAAAVLCLMAVVSSASARNPGGRDFGGAVFSAGVSGTPSATPLRGPTLLAPALAALVRVSDDGGVTIPLLPEELGTSGTVFIDSQTEPWVDVNPANARNLVGMWQEERWSTGGARNLVFGTSFDGGATWANIPLQGVGIVAGGEFQRVTDPWVDFGPGNHVYGTSLAFDDTGPDNAIFVTTSPDGGVTWGPPVQVVKDTDFAFFNDRQSLTVDDFPSSPFYGRVYVGWDRLASKGPGYAYTGDGLVSHSSDGGTSFSPPVLAVPTGNNEQTLTNLPVVLPDGTVLDIGTYYPNQSFNKNAGLFFVTRSTDGGATWGPVRFPEAQRPVGVPGIRSGDGVPNATVDRRTGTIYAVWQDSRFSKGKRDDVLLVRSRDKGRTWSAPVRVNDTPAGAQAAFLPTVKVDENGRVGVVYYDLRDDTNPRDGSFITSEWITFSTDGGRTFGASRRLTPDFDQAAAAFAGGFFLGDYQGLGVAGTTFTPFFVATLATQANGQVGSDVFATRVD